MVVTTTASPTTPTIERIRTIYIWLGCAGCLASMLIPFALLGLIGYLFSEPRDPALLMLWVFLIAPALIFVVMYVLHKRIPPDAPYEVGSIPLSFLDPGLDRIDPSLPGSVNKLPQKLTAKPLTARIGMNPQAQLGDIRIDVPEPRVFRRQEKRPRDANSSTIPLRYNPEVPALRIKLEVMS